MQNIINLIISNIGKLLGRGAIGEVYESIIKGHNGKYAVKKIIKEKYKKIQKDINTLKVQIILTIYFQIKANF